MTTFYSNNIEFSTPSETTTATFLYDGADPGNVTIRVYGATVGHTYTFAASDPNSSVDDVVATETSFTFVIANVGGFLIPLNFSVDVWDDTTGFWIAGTIFTIGSTQEFPNAVTWDYDGDTTVSATFISQVGRFYQIAVADGNTYLTNSPVAGTGGQLLIDYDYTTEFVGSFSATLYYRQQVDA